MKSLQLQKQCEEFANTLADLQLQDKCVNVSAAIKKFVEQVLQKQVEEMQKYV